MLQYIGQGEPHTTPHHTTGLQNSHKAWEIPYEAWVVPQGNQLFLDNVYQETLQIS